MLKPLQNTVQDILIRWDFYLSHLPLYLFPCACPPCSPSAWLFESRPCRPLTRCGDFQISQTNACRFVAFSELAFTNRIRLITPIHTVNKQRRDVLNVFFLHLLCEAEVAPKTFSWCAEQNFSFSSWAGPKIQRSVNSFTLVAQAKYMCTDSSRNSAL